MWSSGASATANNSADGAPGRARTSACSQPPKIPNDRGHTRLASHGPRALDSATAAPSAFPASAEAAADYAWGATPLPESLWEPGSAALHALGLLPLSV